MNILAELEKEHSLAMRKKIVRYVGTNPQRFAKLVDVFLAGPYRITQRAAWPLSFCVEEHPELVKPHLRKLIRFMDRPGTHDAVRRNVLRLMTCIAIPVSLQGIAAESSIRFLSDVSQPVAVRCFALSVLTRLADQHPELMNEVVPIIEEQLPFATPAFRSRARRALSKAKSVA